MDSIFVVFDYYLIEISLRNGLAGVRVIVSDIDGVVVASQWASFRLGRAEVVGEDSLFYPPLIPPDFISL